PGQGFLAEAQRLIQARADVVNGVHGPWVVDVIGGYQGCVESPRPLAEPAGPTLDVVMSILAAGLTRSKGSRAADVQAHLGWAHWLNHHIAEREFGPAAEQNLRAALATDPSNVYANAMLGNWMLQNNENFAEAVEHLHTAVASGKVRPWVRLMQLGGLSSCDHAGARAELVRAANAMRKGGESLSPDEKHRVFDICCNVTVTEPGELAESLAAVAPKDAWETWLWLENAGSEASSDSLQGLNHDFIQANLLEISGHAPQALAQYRLVQQKLRSYPNAALNDVVDAAVHRLSRPGSGGE
ncbi:MAG: hypothetical protein WBD06_16365, partial [Acidobacteriaceae bacterium]